jgi:hypothetical protein
MTLQIPHPFWWAVGWGDRTEYDGPRGHTHAHDLDTIAEDIGDNLYPLDADGETVIFYASPDGPEIGRLEIEIRPAYLPGSWRPADAPANGGAL